MRTMGPSAVSFSRLRGRPCIILTDEAFESGVTREMDPFRKLAHDLEADRFVGAPAGLRSFRQCILTLIGRACHN
jgi:hypothetical protein